MMTFFSITNNNNGIINLSKHALEKTYTLKVDVVFRSICR